MIWISVIYITGNCCLYTLMANYIKQDIYYTIISTYVYLEYIFIKYLRQ